MIKYIIALTVLLFFTSCHHPITKEEMVKYIYNIDNGLRAEDSTTYIKYTAIYKPKVLLFGEQVLNKNQVSDSLHYFELQLSTKSDEELVIFARNRPDYQEFMHFLSNEIQNYIYLTTNKNDTIVPVAALYSPTFGYAKSTNVLVVFESNKIMTSKWFNLHIDCIKPIDFEKVNLKFKTKYIYKIPKLQSIKIQES